MSTSARRRAFAILLLVTVMTAGLAPAAAPGLGPATATAAQSTPSATGQCVAGWQEQPVPSSALESTPFEIVTHKGKPAWVVGGSNSGPLVLRWRSTYWKHMARSATGHRGFVGAVASGDQQMLAVGYEREPSLEFEPYVGRMSSGAFSTRKPPRPTNDRAGLADIAVVSGGKQWVVGTRLYRGRLMAFASRWSGSKWTHHPPASGSGAGLLAVEQSPSGTLWTVGWKEVSAGRPKPLIGRWNKGRWETTRGPNLGGGTGILTDLSFASGNDGYAVGYQVKNASDHHHAILFHWNGKAWTRIDLPWAADFSALPRAISVAGDGQIWIGGAQLATESRETRGFVAHYAGGAWEVDVLGVPKDVRSEVTDVAAIDKGAIAVAAIAGTTAVLRSCEPPTVSLARKRKVSISAIEARVAADEVHVEDELPLSRGDVAPAGTLATLASPVPAAAQGFKVRDRTRKAGLAIYAGTYDGFASDMDGNGRKDVFISRHGGQLPLLMMNCKSGFVRAAGARLFSVVDRHGCDVADVDRSGARDILCAVGRGRGKQITRHELTIDAGKAGGHLDRSTAGLSDPLGRGRVVEFIHLDKDGWPDVFVGTAPDRDDALPSLNRFYRNNGGTLAPAHDVGLDKSHGAICSWSGDIDRDRDEDLAYCTFWPIGSRRAGVRLMRNEGGKLVDRTVSRGVKPMGDIDIDFADVTGDGRKDLIQLTPSRLRVSKYTRSGYVRVWEAAMSDGVAIATGDADNDGRSDIYVARGNKKSNKPDRLLVSRKQGRTFVSVAIPTTSKGAPDDVFALDYDKNGYADFVVLNGGGKKGPVKLLASYPR